MKTSTAYILVKKVGFRYSFDGVVSVSHSLSLKVSMDTESSEDADYVNHARNEPDVVTLSVVASDAQVPVQGWSRQMMTTLAQIKEMRLLCQVVTGLRTYDNMILTALAVQQDENCPDGWMGTLTFTHTEPQGDAKSNDNASAPVSSGNTAVKNVGKMGGSVMQTILREAGIQMG